MRLSDGSIPRLISYRMPRGFIAPDWILNGLIRENIINYESHYRPSIFSSRFNFLSPTASTFVQHCVLRYTQKLFFTLNITHLRFVQLQSYVNHYMQQLAWWKVTKPKLNSTLGRDTRHKTPYFPWLTETWTPYRQQQQSVANRSSSHLFTHTQLRTT